MQIRVYGNSMEPIIKNRSLIELHPIKPSEVKVGDIVCFRDKGILRKLIGLRHVHRIISIDKEKGSFTTKGENRVTSGSYEIDVPINNIESKVILELEVANLK